MPRAVTGSPPRRPIDQVTARRPRHLSATVENEAVPPTESEVIQTDWIGDLCGGSGCDSTAGRGRCAAVRGRTIETRLRSLVVARSEVDSTERRVRPNFLKVLACERWKAGMWLATLPLRRALGGRSGGNVAHIPFRAQSSKWNARVL